MSDMPTGTRGTLLSATVSGDGDAVLALDGPIGSDDVTRMQAVLSALLDYGVQHLIVDLSAASPPPVALREVLRRADAELLRRGGWLLTVGLDGRPRELLDAFRVYQETRG